ncbi:calcium-activated potassium channel slowpoke-like [Panulirus ornatus]|uniref:calcium-activated potassium channel slowpoke-like n=1 Tax=Panulirus ornatus TaxID=150431 RepID=UPI003A8AA67D
MIKIINCSDALRYFDVRYHILAATLMVLLFAVLESFLQKKKPLIRSEFRLLHKVYAIMIYVVASLSDLYLFGLSGEWTLTLTRIINVFFFIRIILVFLHENRQEGLATFVEAWLMVHTIWEIKINTYLYGYEFLSLVRLGYYHTVQEFYDFFGRRGKLLRIVVGTLVVFTVMASMVEFAEETRVGKCVNEEDISPGSSFSYLYMTLVSVSTVGYGDITPDIHGSKILVCLFFLTAIPWLQKRISRTRSCMNWDFLHMPDERSRTLLLWSGPIDKLSKFLMDFSKGEAEVLVVSETEETEKLNMKNVTVLHTPEVTPSILKNLLRDNIPGRHDRVIIVNSSEVDASHADSRVLKLATKVKESAPHVSVIVHVQLSSTCKAIENLRWWQPSDHIVCTEQLMNALVAQTVAAAGAASLFCNLITPQHNKRTGDIKCVKWFMEEYFRGENLTLCSSTSTFPNAELFSEAASDAYSKGLLLLGCWNLEQWQMLPYVLPAKTNRVYLAPPQYVTEKQWVDTGSLTQITSLSSTGETESFVISDEKKVYEIKADGDAKNVQGTNDTSPAVWVLRKRPSSSEYSNLSSLLFVSAHLRKKLPGSRLVTNIVHSSPSKLDSIALDPYWHVDDVSEDIIPSAIRYAHQFRMLYCMWKRLLEDGNIVEVKVTAECTYGSLFRPLIRRNMLPLGACVRMNDFMCNLCKKDFEIASPNWFPFTNPHPELPLTPGDKVIALITQGGEEITTAEWDSWSAATASPDFT